MSTHGLKQFRSALLGAARQRTGARTRRRLASAPIIASAGLALAGTAFATGLVSSDDESPPDLTPVPNTTSLVATAPDPHGSLAWGLRVSDSKTGGICFTVNRVKNGQYGRLAANGAFTELPPERGQSCGPGPAADNSLVGANAQAGTLVIHGVAGGNVSEVRVGDKRLTPTTRGGWIATFAGENADLADHPVQIVVQDGTVVTYPWNGPPTKTPAK